MASTLAAQQPVADALAQIFRDFGHLPGAEFRVGTVYRGRLDIVVYDDLADFEAWREALGIASAGVEFKVLPSCTSLVASCTYAGVGVVLTGFGPLPEAGDR